MRVAFVGVGSIAKRHIINLSNCLKERELEAQIDVYRSGKGSPLSEDIQSAISSEYQLDDISSNGVEYDMVFITNPTAFHMDALLIFREKARFFFIEKPVFDTSEVSEKTLSLFSDKICYVACPLRYNPVLEYIKENIDLHSVISARAISSSYLPEWRPGTDYRKCYSAHKDMGGGVDIDLIHEWDYLSWLFGNMICGFAISGTMSKLEIDSNDIAIYVARTEKTAVEVHLDYCGRKSMRELMLLTDEDTIRCDILGGIVEYLVSGQKVSFEKARNYYQIREIEHFLDIVSGKITNDSTIEHALKVLRYAKGDFR